MKAENIYIVTEETGGSNNREYHQPGCKDLIDGVADGSLTIVGAYPTASFQRQSIRMTENAEDDLNFYLQAIDGDTITGCYNCIVDATGDFNTDDIIDGTIEHYEDENNILYKPDDLVEIRTAYLTALARERQDLYKSNFDLSDLGN